MHTKIHKSQIFLTTHDMEDIVQILLNEKLLSLIYIGRLAKSCKQLRKHLRSIKNTFTWIAHTKSLDLLRWRSQISDTHHVLQTALKMNKCAQDGDLLLTWCCSPGYWSLDYDLRPQQRKFSKDYHPKDDFNLELMIKSDRPLRCLGKGKSTCYHMYDDTGWGYNMDAKDLFQHVTGPYGGWSVRTRGKNTKWSSSNDWDDWLTSSDSLATCSCQHCKTYKTFPSRDCPCPKCSDSVYGPTYWTKLTNPE